MNSNKLEGFFDHYYNTFFERNDIRHVVITPQYIEEHI